MGFSIGSLFKKIPVVGAAYGAFQGATAASDANKANAYQDAVDEAERQRAASAASIYEAPQLHGAEQRKTIGNTMALGFLKNFAADPSSGAARNSQMGAVFADPWQYRSIASLMAKHPTTIKGPKRPKASVFGGALRGAVTGGFGEFAANRAASMYPPGYGSGYGEFTSAGVGGAFNPPLMRRPVAVIDPREDEAGVRY